MPPAEALTRGAAFMLVTTLALAVALHPLSGSLIYGPTSRFWILSPVACLLDTLAIWLRLGEHVVRLLNWPWFYDTTSGVSAAFGLRDAALAMVAARALNAPSGGPLDLSRRSAIVRGWARLGRAPRVDDGARGAGNVSSLATVAAPAARDALKRSRRRTAKRRQHAAQCGKVLDEAVREIDKGFPARLGIGLPIVAQYVKTMVILGAVLPKVINSVLFVHWVTMEMVFLLANPERGNSRSPSKEEDLVVRVGELLFLEMKSHSGWAIDDTMLGGPLQRLHVIVFGGLALLLMDCECWAIGVLWAFCSCVLTFRGLLDGCSIQELAMKALTLEMRAQYLEAIREMQNVGVQSGLVFFLSWIMFCASSFDSTGTERPDWPWLDWLG